LTGLHPKEEGDYGNGPFKTNKADLAARKTESFPHLFKQQFINIFRGSEHRKQGHVGIGFNGVIGSIEATVARSVTGSLVRLNKRCKTLQLTAR